MNRQERGLRIVSALESADATIDRFLDPTPMFVALLHGAGCLCKLPEGQGRGLVVGPFVNAHPLALLGWAQAQCEAGVVARMLRPSEGARQITGSR